MLNLLVTGKSGRMGQAILQAAAARPDVSVAATHDAGEDLESEISKASCVIDFTIHSFTKEVVEAALRHGTHLVIGTTGHTDEERAFIHEAARKLPIVFASNYSVGVNTLFWLTRKAAQILTQDRFDIEVIEMHHKHKIDSPSGTARTLLEILNEETHTSYQDDITHGRFGDVVGDHTVLFAADGERVELTHKASSRLTFAAGAVRAAVWLQDKPAGLYDMQDVLGLR
jgi:4-hydroxy-tetrahydrodipicolinate reductase